MAIRGDSTEYDLLQKWCDPEHFKQFEHTTTCEIGVREGMGSKIILDTIKPTLHIGVDPYGNLKYQHYDNSAAYTCDYTDDMYHQMMIDFKEYRNFTMFKITDLDFMARYHYIMPFHFVHFDGPHRTKDVIREAVYFADRAVPGTRFVFDDYPKYDQDQINKLLMRWDFKVLEKGENKICLEKTNQK